MRASAVVKRQSTVRCSGELGPLAAGWSRPQRRVHHQQAPARVAAARAERAVGADFKAVRVKAGLPPMRFHDLRHAAISLMLAQGVPLAAASKLAGHSQISLTSDLYGHLLEEMADDDADRIGAVFEAAE